MASVGPRLVALLVLAPIAAAPATGFHGDVCSSDGANPATHIAPGADGFSGVLTAASPGPIPFLVSLGPGPHALVVEWIGWGDIAACKVGEGPEHACAVDNVWPFPDLCLASVPGNPGAGPALEGPGDFVIFARWLPSPYPCDGCPVTFFVGLVIGA
ncbi:MAG TPA: hypothetical protein VGR28_07790 [Candidatus Thermoplasmatota archaeon]|nr:hypothetical protein [Candidatus Thermoplasmatota archaeon]